MPQRVIVMTPQQAAMYDFMDQYPNATLGFFAALLGIVVIAGIWSWYKSR